MLRLDYFKYRFCVAGAHRNQQVVMVIGDLVREIGIVRSIAEQSSDAIRNFVKAKRRAKK